MDFNLSAQLMSMIKDIQHIKAPKIQKGTVTIQIVYLSSLCDEKLIHSHIVLPFLQADGLQQFEDALKAAGAERQTELQYVPSIIFGGSVIILWQGNLYALKVKKSTKQSTGDVRSEHTIFGPQSSLAEDVDTNLAIIRSRYPRKELRIEHFRIGDLSQTKVTLVFDAALAKPHQLKEVRQRLQSIHIDVLQAAGQLELLMNKKRISLFPTMMITERQDRIVFNLAQGKAVLLIEGTPFCLCMPCVFFDFIASMDDLYNSFWISRSLLVMRYIALFLTIALPAIYVSIVSFNPEIARVQLTMSIAGSRAAVPYPSYIEVLIMLFMIEALTEASLRPPKSIGSTATTVGGLILGQAAQQAGLVSSIMIIITSVVAISNFVIPLNAMSFAMRIVKYPVLLLASLFGIIGTGIGFFLLIAFLARQRSLGEPFFKLFVGEKRSSRKDRTGAPS